VASGTTAGDNSAEMNLTLANAAGVTNGTAGWLTVAKAYNAKYQAYVDAMNREEPGADGF